MKSGSASRSLVRSFHLLPIKEREQLPDGEFFLNRCKPLITAFDPMSKETVAQTTEITENEEATSTDSQTVEGSSQEQTTESKEVNEYKKLYEEAQAELDNKNKLLELKDEKLKNKSRALKAVKSGEDDDDELIEKAVARIEAKQAEKSAYNSVNELAGDENEAKLARFHLDNTIKRSGDAVKDAKAALAIANAETLYEMRQAQIAGEAHEESLSRLSSSVSAQAPRKTTYKDPVQRKAEEMLDLIKPAAKKFLGRQ